MQRKYYRAVLDRNFSVLNKSGKRGESNGLRNISMELRKLCLHPFLLNGAEDAETVSIEGVATPEKVNQLLIESSTKFALLDKLLPKLKADGHRVLIFSQMTRVLDMIEDVLRYRSFKYERIDGNVKGIDRQQAIDRYCAPGSEQFVFLLGTKAGGVGINLTAADTVIIFDSDWNPQNDLQAQARCHRIGQQRSVQVFRLVTSGTYEQQMFERSCKKLGLDQALLMGRAVEEKEPSKHEMEDMLKFGAYNILQDEGGQHTAEQSIEEILEHRAQKVVYESEAPQGGSTFSKAKFSRTKSASGSSGDGEEAAEEVQMDDPNFWAKVLPEEECQHRDDDLVVDEPRKRVASARAKATQALKGQLDAALMEGDAAEIRLTPPEEGYDPEDRDNSLLKEGGPWYAAERDRLLAAMAALGTQRWPEIHQQSKLTRRSHEEAEACGLHLQKLVTAIVEAGERREPVVYPPVEGEPSWSVIVAEEKFLTKMLQKAPVYAAYISQADQLDAFMQGWKEPRSFMQLGSVEGEKPARWWHDNGMDDMALMQGMHACGAISKHHLKEIKDRFFSEETHDPDDPWPNEEALRDRLARILEANGITPAADFRKFGIYAADSLDEWGKPQWTALYKVCHQMGMGEEEVFTIKRQTARSETCLLAPPAEVETLPDPWQCDLLRGKNRLLWGWSLDVISMQVKALTALCHKLKADKKEKPTAASPDGAAVEPSETVMDLERDEVVEEAAGREGVSTSQAKKFLEKVSLLQRLRGIVATEAPSTLLAACGKLKNVAHKGLVSWWVTGKLDHELLQAVAESGTSPEIWEKNPAFFAAIAGGKAKNTSKAAPTPEGEDKKKTPAKETPTEAWVLARLKKAVDFVLKPQQKSEFTGAPAVPKASDAETAAALKARIALLEVESDKKRKAGATPAAEKPEKKPKAAATKPTANPSNKRSRPDGEGLKKKKLKTPKATPASENRYGERWSARSSSKRSYCESESDDESDEEAGAEEEELPAVEAAVVHDNDDDDDSDEDVPFIVLKMKAQSALRRKSDAEAEESSAAEAATVLEVETPSLSAEATAALEAEKEEEEKRKAAKKAATAQKRAATLAAKKAAAAKVVDDATKAAAVVESDSDDDVPLMDRSFITAKLKEDKQKPTEEAVDDAKEAAKEAAREEEARVAAEKSAKKAAAKEKKAAKVAAKKAAAAAEEEVKKAAAAEEASKAAAEDSDDDDKPLMMKRKSSPASASGKKEAKKAKMQERSPTPPAVEVASEEAPIEEGCNWRFLASVEGRPSAAPSDVVAEAPTGPVSVTVSTAATTVVESPAVVEAEAPAAAAEVDEEAAWEAAALAAEKAMADKLAAEKAAAQKQAEEAEFQQKALEVARLAQAEAEAKEEAEAVAKKAAEAAAKLEAKRDAAKRRAEAALAEERAEAEAAATAKKAVGSPPQKSPVQTKAVEEKPATALLKTTSNQKVAPAAPEFAGLPEGWKRLVHKKSGKVKFLAPDGTRHSTFPGQPSETKPALEPSKEKQQAPTPSVKERVASCSPPVLKADISFEGVEKKAYDSPELQKKAAAKRASPPVKADIYKAMKPKRARIICDDDDE